jgi:prepilin-type N-terminal cleavage/methylation domain-containing protein
MPRLTEQRGFTIVEVMVAVVVLLTGVLGTLAMLDTANKRGRTASDRQKATSLARDVVERAKGLPYVQVEPSTIVSRLREDPALAGSGGSPWRITRDGTTFTVRAEVCWLDEPADGLGPRGANFCPGASPAGGSDSNPIDYKRVTITTSWRNSSGAGSSKQSTLVTARGGDGDAPAIEAPRLTSPASSPITSPMTTSASFAVTTAADASSVVWSVDGSQQGAANGTGRNWNFSWQLPPFDGTYDISVQSFGPSGQSSEPRSTTVIVNRFAPLAPTNYNAGRNSSVVEAEWAANKERDVIGYKVYRSENGGPATLACPLTSETWCVDPSPPPQLGQSGQSLTYWVVAVDRSPADADRDGAPTAKIEVNISNRPPNPPGNLRVVKDGNGNTELTWVAPGVEDPDSGDRIHSYRIYRDGTAVGNRHNRVDGTETFVVDPRTWDEVHQYWVTAVDTHMQESAPLGPVSG